MAGILGLAGAIALGGCSAANNGNGTDSGGSEQSVGKAVGYKIIGIDPGAGLMAAANRAVEDYGLTDWTLVEGSGAAMTIALDKAIKKKEPIIVTGWTPHWMFGKYDLKYLDDPKKSFGEDEEIHTIVRGGLKQDAPSVYEFLDRFEWTDADMAKVMVAIQEGAEPAAAAADWAKDNAALIDGWVDGIEKVSGKPFKLAYVAWDSEIASTNVVAWVLENRLGYKTELLQVEAGPMWAGVANGDADAIVAAWLPITHKDYAEQYKDKYEDLGANLKGTRLGLVVPSYMDISSIEDLAK
ncbi:MULTISPECIES: glycine betaine ABC transporter substrate-binding protein [unclassified Paenibacillus]|uniref:glycine betaine ABC transporter substrate-binding protein n=1 Tax=unclassified Paenibacillus TaxID=185978 RepID=UPI0009702C3B|nr:MULTISPECIES: glycine betaine ABC transporter substrate-binding protein [unclassified Paenibacillus]ASS66115.1 glycine/betaine ABC transporter [Paenibacillus sp. RUD330]